jgi:hypothetical protein
MPLKGSSLEGKIQDIQVRGQGILEIDKNKISLQKIPDLTNQNFLSITGKFKHFIFKDNPIRRNPKLKYYPHSKIIKTKMEILDAQIIVKDLQSFVFKRPTPFQKSSLQKLALKSLSIHDILARGIIWGNFSLPLPLRWVDGTFPKIGKEFDPKTNKVESSRISFDSIRILNDPKIKQTEVQNGLIYLYEEKGHKQYLKIKIHDLNLDPKKLFFKKDPVIGWKFSVPARGGAFESGTIEPDLSERRTRPIRRRAKSVRRKGVSRHHTPKK